MELRALSAAELLDAWDRGLKLTPGQRALALLGAASPARSPETLAQLSIGERDAHLLTLREWTFGPRLAGAAGCPLCGEPLEFVFDVADVRQQPGSAPTELVMTSGEFVVQYRLPNSGDLAAITDCSDVTAAREVLVQRCIAAAQLQGAPCAVDRLSAGVVDAVAEHMSRADPQADVELALTCPACGHQWQSIFDIAAFFWDEVHAWARRTLREVHALASAYGWREADVLALSPRRRQLYLEMASG
jgi:uncharacterized protein (UPF0212 family)